uniref:Syntaxin-17 n=1 Tax=Mesocestoides corti TaxID=53468 RepID=A0A5K3FUE9_MESCO
MEVTYVSTTCSPFRCLSWLTNRMTHAHKIRRMRQLLKRVSQEMRRVTSRPMPVPSTPDSNQVSLSSRQLSTKDDLDEQPSWLVEPPQMEFSLTEELISSMQVIVSLRQQIFASLASIPLDDALQGQKADILRRIQDVETQALIFLTLPPTNEGGWEEWEIADRINEIFNRYLENAERCLEDANALVRGETRRNEKSPDRANRVSTVVLPEALQIPGFSQRDAAAINRSTSDSLFHLFSNPDLRSTTSSVKMVIGSACSQACRIVFCCQTTLSPSFTSFDVNAFPLEDHRY